MQKTAKGCRIAWWRQRWLAKTLLVMRLTIVLMTVALLEVHAKGVSQSVSLTGKDMPVTKVFTVIKEQTGYTVFGNLSLLENAKPVTIRAKDMPLEEFLEAAMNGQPFNYELSDKMIILSKKILEPSVFDGELLNPPVSGVIRDANGNPIAGVNVVVKGTRRGITTDAQGKFFIEAKENDVLVISSIGYNAKEVKITSVNVPHIIALDKSISELDEVQYIAYGTQTKRFSVGNVTTIKAVDIEKQPVNNPLLALQGRVSGLDVNQETGMNGGAVKMRIQGENSIQNGNNPLVIVDGVPFPTEMPFFGPSEFILGNLGFGSPLSFINLNDIESIDVLKDADATSIYGTRAANGAILITTQKGKAGKMRININLQRGWSEVTRKMDLMNSRQYLDMRYEAFRNSGQIPVNRTQQPAPFLYAPDITIWDTTRYTDWQKELIGGTAKYSNFHASLAGGTTSSSYMVGMTYNHNTDVFPGDHSMKSGALHFNFNIASSNQKFKLQITGTYTVSDNSLPGKDLTKPSILLVPVAPSLFSADSLNWALNSAGSSTWQNPLGNTYYHRFSSVSRTLYNHGLVSYNIFPGLTIRSLFGYTQIQSESEAAVPLAALQPQVRRASAREAVFNNSMVDILTAEPQINYNVNFGSIKMDVLAGGTLQQNTMQNITLTGRGYTSDLLMDGIGGAASVFSSLDKSNYKYTGIFTRVGVRWKDKYLLNANGRRDGSSRFGDKQRFHDFGSIGIGWIFSEERILQQVFPALSFGKIRSSYGTTGSDQIPDYSFLSSNATMSPEIPYQGARGMSVYSIYNAHLQWEETQKWQAGIDLGFWKDRVLLSATYSRNRSSNQLMNSELPSVTGFLFVSENFPATLQNTSWEFILNTAIINTSRLKWTSNINMTIPRNKLVSFPDIEKSIYANPLQGIVVGQPKGTQRLIVFGGVDPATGRYIFLDKNGNPGVGDGSFGRSISTQPIYYGGWQHSISFKEFQLDFLFQFKRQWGTRQFDYWNGEIQPGRYAGGGYGNQPVSVLDRWQQPGDRVIVQKFTSAPSDMGLLALSEAYYSLDASFIRLENLSFSWQMPAGMLKKLGLQNGRLYTQGQNLLTISQFGGMDPENQSFTNLPPLRTWTVGFQIGF